jgi:hypothetical protein
MPEETIYCEMCWTNPAHAHIRDLPICSQCIEEFRFTRDLVYLDKQPYETLDGQRLSYADAGDRVLHFNPRNSEELSITRSATLVTAF